MGWSAYRMPFYSTPEIEVRKLFPSESIIDLAEKGGKKNKQFYLAINKNNCISAYVVLVDLREIDNTNFCYKVLHESEFPAANRCPKKILKLLSQTTNSQSLEWRAAQK